MTEVKVLLFSPKDGFGGKSEDKEITEIFQGFQKGEDKAGKRLVEKARFLEKILPMEMDEFLDWLKENVKIKAQKGDIGMEIWIDNKKVSSARVIPILSFTLFQLAKIWQGPWQRFKGGE